MSVTIEAAADMRDLRVSEQSVPTWVVNLAWCLAAVAMAHAIYVLLAWIDIPILDQHPWRQVQTALTAYWLMHGGPFFAYETPIVGSGWSIPFEFPLYQGLVAIVATMGVKLEVAGRLISFAFFLGGLWPIRMLWKDLSLPPVGLPIVFALLLTSPQYSFWSRTFMIESCAWCLALLWLGLFVRFLVGGRLLTGIFAIVVGLLAVLAKATTLPAFVLIGGMILLPRFWRWIRAGLPRTEIVPLALALAAMLLPLAGGFAWVAFSDTVKMGNPIGQALMTSDALREWNYGTLAQRVSVWAVLPRRMLPDIFGPAWPLAVVAVAVACFRRRQALAMLVLVAGFVTPLLVFTHLHIFHNYYQYANAGFIIAAFGLALGFLARRDRSPFVAAAVLCVVLIAQSWRFQTVQRAWMAADTSWYPPYRIALLARDRIPPDGSLVVIGQDWASTVPYYAERKAMALPYNTPLAVLQDALRDPQAHLAGTRFAGVVDCGAWSQYGSAGQTLVEAFLADRATLAEYGTCRLLSADR